MIRCYYTKETIDTVSKARRYRAIGCGGFWYGLPALALIVQTIQAPAIWLQPRDVLFLLAFGVAWVGAGYFFHWLLCNIEKTTLEHAGDEITLDDAEIRLVKADGVQITFPREGLKIRSPYYACGRQIFRISTAQFASIHEIVLTSDMENAKELVETIQPGSWDEGSE